MTQSNLSSQAPAPRQAPSLVTLILLSGLSIMSLNMFLPSLGNIAAEFRTEYAVANLSIAGYAAATAVLQLILGPLSDRYGRRPVVLGSMGVFVLASIGCFLATSIEVFLAFRMGQAVIVGGIAISMAIVRDSHKSGDAARVIGTLASFWAVGPILGPVLGGVFDEFFGWRAVFAFFVLAGGALFTLVWFDLKETNSDRTSSLLDQARAYPDLLRSKAFWTYAMVLAFSIGAFYAFLGGAPFVAHHLFGIGPGAIGVVLGSITFGFMIGSFISGRITGRRFQINQMILLGRIVALIGICSGILLYLIGYVEIWSYFGATVCVGLGNGLSNPSASTGVMSARPRLAGSAAGLSGAITVAVGAGISSITGTLLSPETGGLTLLLVIFASLFLAGLAGLFALRLPSHR